MIHVCVTQHNDFIQKIVVTGHADSDVYGKDLVCAAVSCLLFGACNAMNELAEEKDAYVKDNEIGILSTKGTDVEQTILHTVLIQLETIQETNKAYIRIEKKEV